MFKTLLKTFSLAWRADKFYVITLVISSVIKSLMRFLSIYSIKIIVDSVASQLTQEQKLYQLATGVILFASSWIVNNVVAHFKEYLAFIHIPKINNYLDIEIITKIDRISSVQLESEEFHNIYTNIQTFGKQKFSATIDSTGEAVQSFLNFIYTLFIVFSSNFIIGLIILISAFIEVFYQSYVSKKLKALQDEVTIDRHKVNYFSLLTQDINNYFNLKSFNLFPFFTNKIEILNDGILRKLRAFHIKFKTRAIIAGTLGNLLGTFAPILYFGHQAIIGRISVGDTSFYLQIVQEFYRNTFVLYATFNSMFENSLYLSDLFKYLEMPEIKESSEELFPDKKISVRFKNVSMRYPNSKNYALKNISFTVKNGEKIAIVGRNGAGKTTLIKLLSKFYSPIEGKIFVNEIDLALCNSLTWRRLVSYMNQDLIKIFMTLKENVLLGNTDVIDDKEFKHAIDIAELKDDISKLPNKEKTVLGKIFKDGQELSGGQWQKINLARSFYKDSPLILLDEPTSSIDSETEEKIFDSIFNSKSSKTIIIVSHKFSTINRADRILVLDDGELVDQGNHAELMKRNGLYSKMYTQQQNAFQKK